MTFEIILSLVFFLCFLASCLYYRKQRSLKKTERYVVGFDTNDVAASTLEEEPQPPRDPTLIDVESTNEVVFEIDYDSDD